MNETQSAKDYLTSPISSEGLAFTNEFRAHPTFLQLLADLYIVEAGLLGLYGGYLCGVVYDG